MNEKKKVGMQQYQRERDYYIYRGCSRLHHGAIEAVHVADYIMELDCSSERETKSWSYRDCSSERETTSWSYMYKAVAVRERLHHGGTCTCTKAVAVREKLQQKKLYYTQEAAQEAGIVPCSHFELSLRGSREVGSDASHQRLHSHTPEGTATENGHSSSTHTGSPDPGQEITGAEAVRVTLISQHRCSQCIIHHGYLRR